MKTKMLLTAISSAVLLSACATQSAQPTEAKSTTASESTMPSTQVVNSTTTNNTQTPVNPPATQSPPAEAPMITEMDNHIPNAKVKLSEKGNRVIARIYTNWHDAKQGDLLLHWIAPPQTNCISTKFTIMKYREKHDASWAYRTFDHNVKGAKVNCSGNWQVEVIYKPSRKVIASASINVAVPQEKPTQKLDASAQ